MKLVILGVGATFAIAAGLIFGLPLLEQGGGKAEISPLEYEAGDVSMAAGLVKKTFEVKNVGQEDLKIENISTSCDCTKAVFKAGDKTSPEFSMAGMGGNPAFWSETLKPGEKGELEMIFDPNFHGPTGVGPIARAVYFSTSDKEHKKVELKLFANVVH